ncbi:MAG: hypothetical protein QXQ94_08570 [Candidatus Bathyarchaeia archaeon]
MANLDRLNIQVGKNNETIITIYPDADKTPRELRILTLDTVARLLGIDISEALRKVMTPELTASSIGEIVDANGCRYAVPSEINSLAKSGQAGWVTLCENHIGERNKTEANQLASEVKAKFSNIFGSTFEGYLSVGIAKSFQKLIDLKFISYDEYNPDPNNPGWIRRRYWVEPEQAQKMKKIGQ